MYFIALVALSININTPIKGLSINAPYEGLSLNEPYEGLSINAPYEGLPINAPPPPYVGLPFNAPPPPYVGLPINPPPPFVGLPIYPLPYLGLIINASCENSSTNAPTKSTTEDRIPNEPTEDTPEDRIPYNLDGCSFKSPPKYGSIGGISYQDPLAVNEKRFTCQGTGNKGLYWYPQWMGAPPNHPYPQAGQLELMQHPPSRAYDPRKGKDPPAGAYYPHQGRRLFPTGHIRRAVRSIGAR